MPEPVYDRPPLLPTDRPIVDSAPPTEPPPRPDTFLGHFDTDHLVKIRREMSPNPHDGTSYAHVVAFIRSLISRELTHPDRAEYDKTLAQYREEARAKAEADQLAAKQATEKAALPPPDASPDAQRQHAELDQKHAAEQQALVRDRRLAELDAEQTRVRNELAQQQAKERAEALTDDNLIRTGEQHPPPLPGSSPPPPGPRYDPRSGGTPIR